MKILPALLLASSLALVCSAEEANKATPSGPEVPPPKVVPVDDVLKQAKNLHAKVEALKGLSMKVADATISAPFVLKDDAVSQANESDLEHAGKAVFKVVIPADGEYVVHASVNAPGEDANSFYVNFDHMPEDPLMIWDVDVTTDFQLRTVSWRGNGDANNDEIVPKKFKLTKGDHQLIVLGREPGTFLKRILVEAAKD